MAADGYVKISLSFDASDAKQGLRSVSKAFDAMAQEVRRAVDDVADETEKLGTNADTSEVEKELEDIQREADKTREKLGDVDKQKKKTFSGRGISKALVGSLANFASGFSDGVAESMIDGFSRVREHIANKFTPALETLKHIGETLMDTFVFDLMMSALDSAKEKLGEIINADAQLSAQISTIKGNISSAFAPLWNAVYPTVVKILDVVIAITSAIANLSAKIFGGATAATSALNGEAEALGAVGEAAGAASQELGGFDEINTLPSSGGGGGAGGGGAAGAEVTAGLVADLSTTFDDLYERLMSINWETVGTRISDALLSIDFKGIGSKITKGVRFVFTAAGTTLRMVAWYDLGRNIASGLNELTTLLPNLATLLSDWLSAKIDILLGFVEGYDWDALGIAIGQGINNFFTGIEWKKVGLLIGLAFVGLGRTIINAVKTIDKDAILQGILDFIGAIPWGEIAKTLGELLAIAVINGLEYSPLGLIVKGLDFAGIIDFDFSDWVDENVFGDADKATASAGALAGATDGLGESTSEVNFLLDEFDATVDGVADSMGAAADNTSDTAKAASTANSKFKALFSSVQKGTGNITKNTQAVESGTEALAENEKASASTILANAALSLSNKNMASTTSDAMITMDDALTANLGGWRLYARELTSLMMSISRTSSDYLGRMSKAATSAVQGIRDAFGDLPNSISSAFVRAWQSIANALSGSGSSFESITSSMENVFKSSINQMISGLNNVLDRMERQLNETLVTIKRTQINGTKPFANIQTVNLPSIPRLAKGAVIPANNEFLAVLGDQRRGVNIEAPLDTIVEAMETALQRNGSGSPEAVASAVRAALAGMAVTFDGERVGRVVAAQIDANRRADGKFAYDLA